MSRKQANTSAQGAASSAPTKSAPAAELNKKARQTFDKLDKLAQRLENTGISRYVELSQKTGKILWLNFLSGVARGLGFTIGTTIVIAVAYQVVSNIISMNIPFITEALKDFVELIQSGATSTMGNMGNMGQPAQYIYPGTELLPITPPPDLPIAPQ